jgi:hypothetical protein
MMKITVTKMMMKMTTKTKTENEDCDIWRPHCNTKGDLFVLTLVAFLFSTWSEGVAAG